MGNLFSREKHRGSRQSSFKSHSSGASFSEKRHNHHQSHKIDPRDQRPSTAKPKTAIFYPEYDLKLVCTECRRRHTPCVVTQDLHLNAASTLAYRDPYSTYDGPAKTWTVEVDFCGLASMYKGQKASRALKKLLGDTHYDVPAIGGRQNQRGRKKGGVIRGAFGVEEVVDALRREGIAFKSSLHR